MIDRDPAVLEPDVAAAVCGDVLIVRGDEEAGASLPIHLLNKVHDLVGGLPIQIAGGLVRKH